MAKVAVVLSGCGHLDGSEIQETVLSLLELKSFGHTYHCYAPDQDFIVFNHLTKSKTTEKRNSLVEAARIARGEIKPLSSLKHIDYDVLYFPGGMGAASMLSSFASSNNNYALMSVLYEIIQAFNNASKLICATCISPVILAKAFDKKKSITLTLGPNESYKELFHSFGHKILTKKADEFCYDDKNLILTTPCYMDNTDIVQIHQGIKKMVEKMSELLKS